MSKIRVMVLAAVVALAMGCAQMQQGWTVGQQFGLTVGGAIGMDETYVKIGVKPAVMAGAIKDLFGSEYGPDEEMP